MARIKLSQSLYCYSVADIRAIERLAIAQQGIPALQLMNRAGRAAFREIQKRYPADTQMHLFCGAGNNGGDGFVVAGLAADAGWQVQIVDLCTPSKLSGEASAARNYALARVQSVTTEVPDLRGEEGLIVDALLGIGFSGELRDKILDACRAINKSEMPVFALDLPSGVDANSGAVAQDAVVASLTMTFIGAKRGLLTGAAQNCVGELLIDDLGVGAFDSLPLSPHRITSPAELIALFPPRSASAHKGAYGHLLIIGGNFGMGGAVILAAEAALGLGVGKVSVATRETTVAPLLARVPEVMARNITHYNELKPLIDQATAVVIGPGLGTDAWAEQMFLRVLQEDIPLVVDADALRLVAKGKIVPGQDRICYTPHPGEAAAVLGKTVAEVQSDRFSALQNLQNYLPGCWILKGNGTLINKSDTAPFINCTGNPGMASAGMGDVLSGLIGALLAQGNPVEPSAAAAVYLHGAAGDRAVESTGQIGLRATDVIYAIPQILREAGVANG